MNIDEEKNSIIVWTFLVCMIIGIYQVFSVGDISGNFLTLILTQMGIIFGSNVVTRVTKQKSEYESRYDENSQNDRPTI